MKSNHIRPLILVAIFQLLFCSFSFSQSKINSSISGKVLDKSTGEPLEYATISLVSKSSGKTVNGTIADIKGAFIISNIPFDTYMLNIEFIGYEKTTLDNIIISSEKRSFSTGTVSLSPSTRSLQNVTIAGDRPVVESKIDKWDLLLQTLSANM